VAAHGWTVAAELLDGGIAIHYSLTAEQWKMMWGHLSGGIPCGSRKRCLSCTAFSMDPPSLWRGKQYRAILFGAQYIIGAK